MSLPDQPVIHEVNTWVWLHDVRRRIGRDVTLADVPGDAWDEVVPSGVDAVWLMGVWERSPAGRAVALAHDGFRASHRAVLDDLTADDVVGSAYCVRRYVVDADLGGPAGLAEARWQLARRGAALVLDHVPNHVAPDHPWVRERPDLLVTLPVDEPGGFLDASGRTVALGRDPYFDAWPDVVQLDAFAPGFRDATVDTLRSIADQCDGIRCDMAMLVMTDVFARTWAGRVGEPPSGDTWPEVIGRLRSSHPDVFLMAEAYWDLEASLLEQGFDACYDKRLHDRLLTGDATGVRAHLGADVSFQQRLVRFTENHDEPRAAHVLGSGAARAAAVAVATLPGATLWHEGQLDGRRAHVPVLLGRRPVEPVDEGSRRFHLRLLALAPAVRRGRWQLRPTSGWHDNDTHTSLVAWTWTGDTRTAVVVNLSDRPAQGRVQVDWPGTRGRAVALDDLLVGATYTHDGDQLAADGLFVDLPASGSQVLRVRDG